MVSKRTSLYFLVVLGYTSLISLWFVLWLVAGDANWWLGLLNRTVPALFLPVPLLLAWGIFRHRFKPMLLLLAPAFIFLGLYYPYLIPKWTSNAEDAPDLSVMTYNVLFSNKVYDAVAQVILTYKPDLVALQEVQPAMMQALIERLQTTYPYSVMGYENRFGTTAIFSQHPFSEEHIVDLEADRPAVLVTTRIQNRDVTFISTHLLAFNLGFVPPADIPRVTMERTTEQNRQARIILEQLVSRQGIKIVGCDCNSYETSSSYRILNRTLTNAARQKGWTLNAPQLPHTRQDNDLQHIDFVLYQGGLQPINTFVIQESGGSDHYPVLSWFRLD